MKTPIALLNLWHQRAKTAVSVSGVAFALLLVFMQLGFMGAVSHTATNVLDHLRFDILIRAHDYAHLYEPGNIERRWLDVAQSTPGVVSAQPFWITLQNWRRLPTEAQLRDESEKGTAFESQYLPIAVMAANPSEPIFELPELTAQFREISRNDSLLLDDSTQREYGPLDGRNFRTENDLGRETEIAGKSFRLAGLYKLGTGLAANGAVVISDRAFARISPWNPGSTTSLGLVQIGPGKDVEQIARALRARMHLSTPVALPDGDTSGQETPRTTGRERSSRGGGWFSRADESKSGAVQVLSRQEAIAAEVFRWLWQTPIGLIFQLGVLLSLLVGSAIVYMVLSTDVANRLPEYATLLAMGYSRKYLAGIVMTQAMVLSGFGFFAAWGAAELMYRVSSYFSGIPLTMNFGRVVLVCLLGVLMCYVSGMLALRKLWKAEPASLF